MAIFGRQLVRLGQNARRFTTSTVLRDSDYGGVPGRNLPFDINNKYKLTVYFALFFASSFSVPFVAVRHQLLKSAA